MSVQRSLFGGDPQSRAYYAVGLGMPQLAEGVAPEVIREQARLLTDERAARAKWTHRRVAIADILTFPMLGAAGVIACTNSWQCGIVGAVLGVAAALLRAKESRGDLVVHSRDGARAERFYGSPEHYHRADAELEAELKAHGFLIDDIPPPAAEAFKGVAEPGPRELMERAAARQIVADLGVTSAYGKRVLSVLTPLQASELAARGDALFMVDVTTTHLGRDDMSAVGASPRSGWINAHGTSHEYAFDYALEPYDPCDTRTRRGVSEFAAGVYADASTVSILLSRETASAGAHIQRSDTRVTSRTWDDHAHVERTI